MEGEIKPLSYKPANRQTVPMIIINALAALTGAALVWAGATGRLTTIVTQDGQDMQSGIGNVIAIVGGIAVVVSALT